MGKLINFIHYVNRAFLSPDKIRIFLKITFVTLGVFAILGFVWIYIDKSFPCLSLTSEGFFNFSNWFSGPIQLAGWSLGISAIWLTLARMKQTKDIIELTRRSNMTMFEKSEQLFIDKFKDNFYYEEIKSLESEVRKTENTHEIKTEEDLVKFIFNSFFTLDTHDLSAKIDLDFDGEWHNILIYARNYNKDKHLDNINYIEFKDFIEDKSPKLKPIYEQYHNIEKKNFSIPKSNNEFINMNSFYWQVLIYATIRNFLGYNLEFEIMNFIANWKNKRERFNVK